MNYETKDMLAVMQACLDGREIQRSAGARNSGQWLDTPNPSWDWVSHIYRVKPLVITYRRFLRQSMSGRDISMQLVTHEEHQKEPRTAWAGFVRWVDSEWQKETV